MQSSPVSRHFLPLSSKYSQHSVLKHPQSTLFLSCERPSFTPIQNNRSNYSFVYFNFWDFREETGRQRLWTELTSNMLSLITSFYGRLM
jgi:hypothetical protein